MESFLSILLKQTSCKVSANCYFASRYFVINCEMMLNLSKCRNILNNYLIMNGLVLHPNQPSRRIGIIRGNKSLTWSVFCMKRSYELGNEKSYWERQKKFYQRFVLKQIEIASQTDQSSHTESWSQFFFSKNLRSA